MENSKYHFFWGGEFSQWYPSVFEIDNVKYVTAEQYMMAKKALLFKDIDSYCKIMNTTDPKEQKRLGRLVKNFNKEKWESVCRHIVYEANLAKFTQNPKLQLVLLNTVGKELVEASPEDKIWGVGLHESNPLINDKNNWLGTNWLGIEIQKVRDYIVEDLNLNHSVKVFRYHDDKELINSFNGPKIFLAGPTVRGNQPHLTTWRNEAIKEFKKQGFVGALIVPEFFSKVESDQSKDWVPLWESNGLVNSDAIMFWIPRTRELIALTTNMEFGFWQSENPYKMIYGRPDDAYRISYLDIMWKYYAPIKNYNGSIYNSLESTVRQSIQISYDKFKKKTKTI